MSGPVKVVLERVRRPLRPGEREKWTATLPDGSAVEGSRDPEHEACRALFALGITGNVTFIHKATGMAGLTMDIEKGAGVSATEEDRDGLRLRKYRSPDPDSSSPASDAAIPGHIVAEAAE